MNSEHADLMSIGSHCAVPHCGQVDFLPFQCDCCKQTYCLEHRTYSAHNCTKAGNKETQIIVCPLCASGIRLKPGEDPNAAFAAHQRTGCDTRNYARVHRKRGCPVQGCREKLTTMNTLNCKQCGVDVCLKHRLPSDHNCQRIQTDRKMKQRYVWGAFSHASTPAPSTSSASARKEICRQCGAGFSDIRALIDHVEAYHPVHGRGDRCPTCGRQFEDAVQLVNHVERGCGQKRACAIS